MPAVPQNIINRVTELILNHILQHSPELQVAPNPDKNNQGRLQPIEEEINAMEEMLAGVQTNLNTRIAQRKKQRNSLIRFNQLPLEIASNILWLSVVDPWPRKESYSFLRRQQTISRVCSSWRTLVEDSPRFWSIIEFSRCRAAISHFLEKSRSCGLQITGSADQYDWEPIAEFDPFMEGGFLDLISPHIDRTRSLILSSGSMDGLLDVLEKSAPMLEELELDCSGCDFVRPLDLFCGQASRLMDVALQNVAVKWDSGVLRGLRSLSIVEIFEYLPTEGQVRRLLEANPGLEKLDIEARGGADTERFGNDAVQSTGEEKPSPVVMSKMQEFRLLDLPFTLAQAVLGNVEVPSISHLELRCPFQRTPASTVLDPSIKHLIPTLIQRSKGAQQAELTLGRSSVGLAIYTTSHKSPMIQIELQETTPISGFDWLIESFFHAEGLASACAAEIFQVSLKFSDGLDLGEGTFIPILNRLNTVKVKALTIEYWCEHGEELIKYLGEANGDSEWPLPYLTWMKIGGPAKGLADHLSMALQRRMQHAPPREAPGAPRPVMLEFLHIGGLSEVDEDVEKALAKCVASSGTFISRSRERSLIWRLMGANRANYVSNSDDEDIEIGDVQPAGVSSDVW